jgi:hypothetical protein
VRVSELKKRIGAFQFYLLSILLATAMLYIGFSWGNRDNIEQKREIEQFNITLSNLQSENNELTKNLNILGVELEVARIAEQRTKQEIEQGLEREEQLRSDLAFYQQVMAPELEPQGFAIDSFNVEPALSERYFRFELVMMQQEKIKNVIKGNIKVSLQGNENGKLKTISLLKLMSEEAKALKFSFKYFQVIEGELQLPEGFIPEKIIVHADIYQFKRKRGELSKTFDWEISSKQ